MSLHHVHSTWEAVLVKLRRMSIRWNGKPVSDRDTLTITEAIVMCALHLMDLRKQYGGIGTDRELIGWAVTTASTDLRDLGSFLTEAISLLRHVVEPVSYTWFKRQLSLKFPFAGEFLSPVRQELESFLSHPNPRGFYVVYQFLSFLTHVNLVDIDIDMVTEYVETEVRLQSLSYPSHALRMMNSIMREWMKDFSITEENFYPKHGPGATYECRRSGGSLKKYQYLGTDPLIDYTFSKHAGVDVTSYFPFPPSRWERKSRLVFVPKSMKTKRVISAEPATLQYLQQGVASALVDFIHSSSALNEHIDLRDQSRGSRMAISASGTKSFATIDLSSASDTVTVELVKAVFRGTPVYPFLVALRSRTVEFPDGKVMGIAKYAPMGSALCFPVETLIFACAVEYAARRAYTEIGNFPIWRVYGDDIIVQDPLFEDAVRVLTSLGFIINEAKSFCSPSRFRESCGGEGYDGYDVTPLRISRNFYSVEGPLTSHHASHFLGSIELANSASSYGFGLLRSWIVRNLLTSLDTPPLFSQRGEGSLFSSWPDNFRAERSFHKDLQQMGIVVSRATQGKLPDYIRKEYRVERSPLHKARYWETLRQTSNRTGDMFSPEHRVAVPRGPRPTVLRAEWIPLDTVD